MQSHHEVWSALATILKEANWTHLAICSLGKEKSEKRREGDQGGRVSGVLQRQAFPQSEKQPDRGALQTCPAWSLHKEGPVLGCKGDEVRPGGGSKTVREEKELCEHTLRERVGCSLCTQRTPDSPSN